MERGEGAWEKREGVWDKKIVDTVWEKRRPAKGVLTL